jgi:predicted RecA/RadA family phage recombinase
MALRKPLVVISGQVQQIPAGDTLDAVVSEKGVFSLTNGEATALVICSPVYVSAVNTVKKAQANAAGTAGVIGLMATVSTAAAASGSVQSDGILTATTTQWDAVAGTTGGLAPGTLYYLDAANAGKITSTAPSTVGQYVQPIGRALSTVDLEITIGQSVLL